MWTASIIQGHHPPDSASPFQNMNAIRTYSVLTDPLHLAPTLFILRGILASFRAFNFSRTALKISGAFFVSESFQDCPARGFSGFFTVSMHLYIVSLQTFCVTCKIYPSLCNVTATENYHWKVTPYYIAHISQILHWNYYFHSSQLIAVYLASS